MSKKQVTTIEPEWPHKIEIERIGTTPLRVAIEASPQQCKDVARRLRVQGIKDLKADLVLTRKAGSHIIHVAGTVQAAVDAVCVVSGEPLQSRAVEDFEAWFSDEEHVIPLARARREQMSLMAEGEIPIAEEEEDPEPVVEGQIDLGELAVQYLSLGIDPFPQKEGAVFPATDEKQEERLKEQGWHNPFAALKDWKSNKK